MAYKNSFGLAAALALTFSLGLADAQTSASRSAGNGALVGAQASRLAGDWRSTAPVALSASKPHVSGTDLGTAAPGARLERMLLLLDASPAQQQALTVALAQQQNPASSSYHQWLTPTAFADSYSNTASDVEAIAAWLTAQEFTVAPLPSGRGWIEFSGTAAQLEQAFHTQVHSYSTPQGVRLALTAGISVPGALAPLVHGLVSLDGNLATAALTAPRAVSATAAELAALTSPAGAEALTPQLAAQLLHLDTLHASGVTGKGETIAIAARSNVRAADIAGFRAAFGLSVNPVTISLSGADPGRTADEATSVMAASWAGAAAPDAQIVLTPATTTAATDGLDLALAAIVDRNQARTAVVGYSACEAALSEAHQAFYASLYRQAAAQGMALVIAAGDSGASACHVAGSDAPVSSGYSVNALASTPWNTAVGVAAFDAAGRSSEAGALSAWSPATLAEPAYAGGGGASTLYTAPSWQSGLAATAALVSSQGSTSHRLLPDLALPAAIDSGLNPGLAYCFSGAKASTGCTLVRSGGSSAAASLFAGIGALVAQKYGAQGNMTPRLYALSKISGVFDDVRLGSAQLACAVGAAGCDAAGKIGFAASAGFDLATGLGSVNATALIKHWPSPEQIGTNPVDLYLSVAPVETNSTYNPSAVLTFTAAVVDPASAGVPTGTVTFSEASSSVLLSSVPSTMDTTGAASLTLNLDTVFHTLNTYNIIATYNGDPTYAVGVSTPPLSITTEQSATAVTVSPSATPSFGSSIAVVVTVGVSSSSVAPAGALTPTGLVTLQVAGGPTALSYSASLSTSNGVTTATFTSVTFATAGNFSLQATYAGDANYAGSTSPSVALTVPQATPTVAVVASSTTPLPGGTVTLTATVTPPTGDSTVPTGTVTFEVDGAIVGTPQTISSAATASVTIAAPSLGIHTVQAIYSGDTNYTTATSPSITLTVAKISTTLTLTPASTTPTPGAALLLTATLTLGTSTSTLPTGTVTFTLDGASQSVVTISGTTATATITVPASGTHTLQAVYSGDTNFVASSSTVLNITVAKISTTTVVIPSTSTPTSGAAYQVTATVTAVSVSNAALTGTVAFTLDGVAQGTAVSIIGNSASLTLTAPAYGTHTLVATYSGDSTYATSTSSAVTITVARFTTSTYLTPATTTPAAGSPLVVTGSVIPTTVGSSLPTGTLTFLLDGVSQGAIAVSPGNPSTATITLPALIPGAHLLQGIYSGDSYYGASTSAAVTVTVAKSPTTIVIAPATFTPTNGGTVLVAASITSPTILSTYPTGIVTVYLDGVAFGTGTVTAGIPSTAAVTINLLTGGTHLLTATYGGDTYYSTSTTSAPVTIVVAKGATTTTVAATPSTMEAGTKEVLTATVAPVSPLVGVTYTITGTVSFYDNGTTLLGTATLVNNVATLSGLTMADNVDHSITAVYSGSTSWLTSTSGALALAAITLPDTVVLTANYTNVPPGVALILTATVTPDATPATGAEQNPTGKVIFYNGTTIIGTSTLTAVTDTFQSIATLTIQTLPGGLDTVYAKYVGDLYYDAAVSNLLTLTVEDFTITPSATNPPTNLTIVKGSSGAASYDIKGYGGFFNQIQVVCAVPTQDDMTCAASPQQVVPDGTVTFVVQTFLTGTPVGANRAPSPFWPRAAGGTALAVLGFFLLPFGRRARIFLVRRAGPAAGRILTLLLLLVGLGGVGLGCSNSTILTSPGTPLGVATLKITASAYVDNTVVAKSVYLTVNVVAK